MAEIKKRNNEQGYTKAQILASERYANRRDIVKALLDDNIRYTFKTVDTLIENYQRKAVQ